MGDQKLNSLERFRKRSPHLVLEQHSHCEVPAGCGGVVLRWRNPREARPLRFHLYTSGKAECWLDGEPLQRGHFDLVPGRHVLAIVIEQGDRTALLRAALIHDTERVTAEGAAGEVPFRVISAANGSWKATLSPPGEGWQGLGYNDADWGAMAACTIPEVNWSEPGAYQWHACEDAGAPGLRASSLPRPTARVGAAWVRHVFVLPGPAAG